MYTPENIDPSRFAEQSRALLKALPAEGLFAEKSWRISPLPFPLKAQEVAEIERMGKLLHTFQRVSDEIYRSSKQGRIAPWVSEILDRGKPSSLTDLSTLGDQTPLLPQVIRPDLMLTENGFSLTELDSVPGGIGLTGWLAQHYSALHDGEQNIIGGDRGMIDSFASLFPKSNGVDVLISDEAADYRPEMEWLTGILNDNGGDFRTEAAEAYVPSDRSVYRFFELFDLPNIEGIESTLSQAREGAIHLTSPLKPWLEEKAWAALLWSPALRPVWEKRLRGSALRDLLNLIPQSWIADPIELPHQGVFPDLGVQRLDHVETFTKAERQLVLKLSGFNEKAWGSRSVTIGHDCSSQEWSDAVTTALDSFDDSPYILQRFHGGKVVRHPFWDPDTEMIEWMDARARLCPYYFIPAGGKEAKLGGILATLCPADKKIIHGMSDAILVPCSRMSF